MLTKGFTLIELLVVIAILGILYAIALPAYSSFIQDGRRADVQQSLLQDVAVLERNYTRSGGYPDSYPKINTDFYQFIYTPSVGAINTSDTHDSATFELKATPISGQANDACGVLTINHQGQKKSDGVTNVPGCWGA